MNALAANGTSAGGAIGGFAIIIFAIAAYFAPMIIALFRHVPNAGSVTVVNVLTGWTIFGWIIALAMACRSKPPAYPPPYQQYQPQWPQHGPPQQEWRP